MYVNDMLKKFEIEDKRSMNTPMSSSIKVDKDEHGIVVDTIEYGDMIGSLLFLTVSRPDIIFSVGLCGNTPAFSFRIKSLNNELFLLNFKILSMIFSLEIYFPIVARKATRKKLLFLWPYNEEI